ncbi:MAG: Cys-Xaa-Xaa-Xaa repeat radical SAM target protein [Muribaculaceae bacterium]|nr:Cys-Xaa-Xaa-Xaa repeat radical SAM target protein [Muribaculaceae bacterium]
MMKQDKKEELQSRRQFFKKAAKSALPILGLAVLASNPLISKATTAMGCRIDACTGTCTGSCSGTCSSCSAGCSRSCMSGCYGKNRY